MVRRDPKPLACSRKWIRQNSKRPVYERIWSAALLHAWIGLDIGNDMLPFMNDGMSPGVRNLFVEKEHRDAIEFRRIMQLEDRCMNHKYVDNRNATGG
jgi:hypothetical protein